MEEKPMADCFIFIFFLELLRWKLANWVRQLDPVENTVRV